MGLLLGSLARRVLGQYDVALLGREPLLSGKLYFVEENIAATERLLGIPPEQFRLWIGLHEATHAYEFEAHPWLAEYLNSRIAEHMQDVDRRSAATPRHAGCRLCPADASSAWPAALATAVTGWNSS